MATGDPSDFLSRLKSLLPANWFKGSTPILDGTLSGIASALSAVYSLAAYARLQTRIATATDGFLDLIAFDFFGYTLPRAGNETDANYRKRIQAQLLVERGTRRGLIQALTLLTGRAPVVFEPARPADTGAYNTNTMGYNVAGGYGSLALPFQSFVTAYRPQSEGIPNVGGYGNPQSGYGVGGAYVNPAEATGVTDASIYQLIDAVKPLNAIVWTRIRSAPPNTNDPILTQDGETITTQDYQTITTGV